MEYRDYYATLGVPRTASKADIKKAFRKLARQHHPDVNKQDAAAETRFKEITEANEVLSDPEKRKLYDQLGSNWQAYQQGGGSTGPAGANPFAGFGGFGGSSGAPGGVRFEYRGDPEDLAGFSDFFQTFFGGGAAFGGSSGSTATGTRSRVATGSLEDLFANLGSPAGQPGNGRTRARPAIDADVDVTLDEVDDGTKRLLDLEGRRIEVTIPPGAGDGQRIRFSGIAPGGGDVQLRVRVKRHPDFTRSGADLTREIQVSLRDALLGGEVPVRTLNGRVLLRIPPGTQNGRVFRLKGKGLPLFKREGRGDLFVKIRVMLPTDLSPGAIAAVEKFLDLADPRPDHPTTNKDTEK